jgi:hypothetical protein
MNSRSIAFRPPRVGAALLIGLACSILAGAAGAQVVLIAPASDLYEWEYRTRFDVGNLFRTDIDGGGSFEKLRFEGGFGVAGPLSRVVRVRLDFDYAHDAYDFGGASTSGCVDPAACFRGRPFDDINIVDLSAGVGLAINDAIQVVASVPMRWAFERGADELTISAGVSAGLRLRLSERFVTTLGIGVQSEIEDDMSVFPVVALDWQISDQVSIRTRGDAFQGGDGALIWGPSDAFQALVSAGFVRERFRLDDGAPNSDGIGQYRAVPVTIGFRLNIAEGTFIAVEGGVAAAGELLLEDNSGNTLREENFDTAGIIHGAFHIQF